MFEQKGFHVLELMRKLLDVTKKNVGIARAHNKMCGKCQINMVECKYQNLWIGCMRTQDDQSKLSEAEQDCKMPECLDLFKLVDKTVQA